MATVMLHGGVPSAAARALAREGVSLEVLKRFDVTWAVNCLEERHVKLNQRELQQLLMVTAEAHGNVPLSLQVTPQKGQENAAPRSSRKRGCRRRSSPGKALVVLQVRDCWLLMQVVVERSARRDVQQEVRRQAPVQQAVRVEPPQPRRAVGGAGGPDGEEDAVGEGCAGRDATRDGHHGACACVRWAEEAADDRSRRRRSWLRTDVGSAVRLVRGDDAGGSRRP